MNAFKRMAAYLAAWPFVCAAACGESSETAAQKPQSQAYDTVRVATFNVHRFFDEVCDTGACGAGSYEPAVSPEAYKRQLADIAQSIWNIDADIVLLQEIEKESCLADLREKLTAAIYPSYAFGECGYDASLDVGILARGAITAVETYRSGFSYADAAGKSHKLSRELLRADIKLNNNVEISAFTTHFVSRVSDKTGDRRLAEAVYVQKVIADFVARNPGRFVVFGGDLNDTPADASIAALEKDGVIARDAKDIPDAEVFTWNGEVAFDHLWHSAGLSPWLEKTERVCNANPATGLGTSDHCALKSVYKILRGAE